LDKGIPDASLKSVKHSLPIQFKRPDAFTLIELITVIAIILVLMGLLFPAVNSVKQSAWKAQAKNDIVNLVTATKAYYTDYSQYPLNSTQAAWNYNVVYGDPNGQFSSADLCNILRAIPDANYNQGNQLNPKLTVFLDLNNVKNPANPRSGIVTANFKTSNGYNLKPGAYVDPWGDEYVVFIDGSYRGDVSNNGGLNEYFYWNEQPPLRVRVGVCGVSMGPDRTRGTSGNSIFTGSDDVATW